MMKSEQDSFTIGIDGVTTNMKQLYALALPVVAAFSLPLPVDYTVDRFDGIMCDSDMECQEATGYPYDVAMSPNPPKYPRLVGHGCKGAYGPIYAFEEDHLPACREIVAMDWDWQEKIK